MGHMDSLSWRRYFETNRLNRPEPDWHLPCGTDDATGAKLARSLSHFQLGESGEGSFLLAEARRAHPEDPDYLESIVLFIQEEQEHARLLAHLVARFNGTLITGHWTHVCFRHLRRALNLQFEIQILLIAELIGTAYYRMLHAHADDVVLHQVCALVLTDEARHVQFHHERFTDWQAHWLPLQIALWRAQFQILFLAVARVAWHDHRPALTAVGATRNEFLRQARRECAAFLGR